MSVGRDVGNVIVSVLVNYLLLCSRMLPLPV